MATTPGSGSGDDFFSQPMQPSDASMATRAAPTDGGSNNESIPRPKRIACILCRKRKLKCDGSKPSCGTCSRLGHNCEYSEERKKSGPKRGYVKLLEARLKQVENLLETRDVNVANTPDSGNNTSTGHADQLRMPPEQIPNMMNDSMQGIMPDPSFVDPNLNSLPDFGLTSSDDFSWEMIGLGLEEALPNQDVIDEMNQVYFEKIHLSMPMIHRARFLASMDLAPHMRPCVALRYAMWTHACSVTPKYSAYTEHFYARARKYAEQDEMQGHGESMVTLGHCQAWTLIACYEFKLMYFPRAWMSIGRASRLALMMGLHRQDRLGLDVKQTLPPPRDWTDREERRRTFWMAYCQDRYASIGTGWPMEFDERDILTNLPASNEAFDTNKPEPTQPLPDVLNGDGTEGISSFSGVVVLATIYGRNLTHLHRPSEGDNDHDLNGEFWKRHRNLDNILLNISLSLPTALRLPGSINDPNAIFCNMNVHTATICLHQAAIFKADKNRLPAQISAESKRRCIVAADQVANIMKMISHVDLSLMNPFLAFCLYVSARVFVQYLKSRKEDSAIKSSLQFLLAAMQVLKTKNPLTESFLVQLDVDLEGSGLDLSSHSRYKFGRRPAGEVPANTDSVNCSPLFEIRQSQSLGQTDRESGGGSTSSPSHQKWAQNGTNPSYPGLLFAEQNNPLGDLAETPKIDHLQSSTSFSGEDLLYGRPQQANNSGPSPGFVSTDSSGSHSNHPTPASSSNRTGSYTGHSPYQQVNNAFSPGTGTNSSDRAFPEQIVFGARGGATTNTVPNNMATTWNFKPNHLNNESNTQTNQDKQPQEPNNNPMEIDFGRTGMTPGATGMTPLPDSLWQSVAESGNDWMYGWNAGTPPQQ